MRRVASVLVLLTLIVILALIIIPNFLNFRMKASGPERAARAPVMQTSPPSDRSPDYWVVEKFASAPAWSEGADAATRRAAAGRDWGAELGERVARNLRLHFSRVAETGRTLTQEEILQLVAMQKLDYLVGGSIDRLATAVGSGHWRLDVTYTLRRSVRGQVEVIQKERERIEETAWRGPLGARGLEFLMERSAAQIASRVGPAISADILAARD